MLDHTRYSIILDYTTCSCKKLKFLTKENRFCRIKFSKLKVMFLFIQQHNINDITHTLRLFVNFKAEVNIFLVTVQNSKHPRILATLPYWPFDFLTYFENVNLPFLYGIRLNIFFRLHQRLLKSFNEAAIFPTTFS